MFAIDVELLRGVFDAGGQQDDQPPEWPPHPARLFNALVSVADHDSIAELDALRWLERAGAPEVTAAADTVECGGRASFVPTNRLERSASYQSFVARKALGPRRWCAISPSSSMITYTWPGTPSAHEASALGAVARRVPYLGRSTSPVAATGRTDEAGPTCGPRVTWRPAMSTSGGTQLDVARPDYLADLIDAHESGRLPHDVRRSAVRYMCGEEDASPTQQLMTPYGEMIVLGFGGGRRFGQNSIVLLTSRTREAIQAHVDGGPLVLRGAGRRDVDSTVVPRHQIAVVALPVVGHQHADGQLMGVAVVLPRDIGTADRRSVLGGLAKVVRSGLHLGKLGVIALDPTVQTAQTLRPERWSKPSRTWVSATPISANRHLRKPTEDALIADVRAGCQHLDLPTPVEVAVSIGPLTEGTDRIPAWARVRHAGDSATASYHAVVRFESPVTGPLILGSMRRYGLGLMLPARDATRETSSE